MKHLLRSRSIGTFAQTGIRAAFGFAIAGALLSQTAQAQARTLVTNGVVNLVASATAETPVFFTTMPGARCDLTGGASLPLTVYADDYGSVRLTARPGRNAGADIRVLAICNARGRQQMVTLALHAVQGAVQNPKPPVRADPNFSLPRGFNPLTAGDDDLQRYGYPPRPGQSGSSDAYAEWLRAVTTSTVRVAPSHVLRPDRIQGPNRSNGTGDQAIWSGMADSGKDGQFRTTLAQWYVPSVSAPAADAPAYSSLWVGVDGAGISKDVIQDGTEQDVGYIFGWMLAEYDAWYEFYPDNGSTQFSNMSIYPGDEIYAVANKCIGSVSGCYYIEDLTQHESASATEPATYPNLYKGNTAEWIVERPTVNGSLYPLPDYVTVTPWNMKTYDTIKKAYEAYSAENFGTYTMYDGRDLLSSVKYTLPYKATFTWHAYQ